ncbi:hypothetical protein ACS0TY_021985 [Phlomoides rotata]
MGVSCGSYLRHKWERAADSYFPAYSTAFLIQVNVGKVSTVGLILSPCTSSMPPRSGPAPPTRPRLHIGDSSHPSPAPCSSPQPDMLRPATRAVSLAPHRAQPPSSHCRLTPQIQRNAPPATASLLRFNATPFLSTLFQPPAALRHHRALNRRQSYSNCLLSLKFFNLVFKGSLSVQPVVTINQILSSQLEVL